MAQTPIERASNIPIFLLGGIALVVVGAALQSDRSEEVQKDRIRATAPLVGEFNIEKWNNKFFKINQKPGSTRKIEDIYRDAIIYMNDLECNDIRVQNSPETGTIVSTSNGEDCRPETVPSNLP